MRETTLALLLAIMAVFHFNGDLYAAEESPFENLSSDENNLRTVFSTEDQNIDSYLDVKQSYENLSELFERAFGTRKEELSLQLVARAQDVLVSKTGAVLNYVQNLLIEAEKTDRISEEELQTLSSSAADFRTIALEYENEIDSKTTLEELTPLSETYNNSFFDALASVKLATIYLSVARGEFLMQQMQSEGNLIQDNINGSASVGGNIAPIQEVFNDGMLDLENAKDIYGEITTELTSAEFSGTQRDYENLLNKAISANKKVSSGHGSLNNVLSSLRALYAQSPWQLEQDGGDQ